jgi:hypothetical protein
MVEVMVACLILVVGILGTVAMVATANQTTARNLAREGATNLAREISDRARQVPYNNLTTSNATTVLQALPGLASTSGGGTWTIVRRNVTYTVAVNVCELDSPADGVGSRNPATFCVLTSSGSGGGGGGGGSGGGSGIWADLGIFDVNVNVGLSGALVDTICNLTGPLHISLGPIASAVRAGADVVLCSSAGNQAPGDANADDFKRVTVDVSWPGGRVPVHLVTLIPNASGAPLT